MSSEWPIKPLSQVAEVITGFPFKGEDYLPPHKGVRVVRGDNVTERYVRWGEKEKCWSEVTPALRPYVLRTGDIVIGMDGSKVGRNFAAIGSEDNGTLLAQRVARVRAREGVSQDFVRYAICNPSFTGYVKAVHTGTSIPHISKGQIEKFEISVPPLQTQISIAAILSALDDRITLLRETNTTLEAIAQALFKSWFVDFDPVHAKMQGRAPEGMDEATAALFPDSIEESELGSVPKGWRVGNLNVLAELNPESWSAKRHPERVLYVDLANTKAGQIDEYIEFSFEDAPSRARRVLRCGDVIVGTVRPGNRSFARIASDVTGLTGSTGFAVLRARKVIDQALVFIAATNDEAIDRLSHLADGGAYPAVRPEVVGSTPLVVATEEIRNSFGDIANTLFASIGANQERMTQLASLRDTLLPRLISGQIDLNTL